MQITLDIWTSFARTFNPNPDPALLAARGYKTSASQLAKESEWLPVTAQSITRSPLRQLQWDSFMTNFKEGDQCDFFDFPLNYFDLNLPTA